MSGEVSAATAQDQPADVSSGAGRGGAAVPCCIPSFAAASELLSAPYSCLVTSTHRRHIGLPPVYLNKKKTGIQEELAAELLKFSESLKGVPLAYDNIRIVGQHGDIYDDSGYVHMDIEANFIVFQPKRGQKLLGTVNKLGPRIGTELEFEVTALDADSVGVLLIRGRLDRTRVQELLAIGESSKSGVTTDQPESPETEAKPELNPEPTEDSPVNTPKKKKKKKKDKVKEEETEMPVGGDTAPELNGTMDEANGNEVGKKKKKKKKEKHLKEEEEEETEVSPMEVHGSDSSGYISDKPSKKRKHESGKDVTSGFSEDPEPPKSKKKRKSGIEQFA
ncbi:DNA-directed RNA polymerase I subunit RPA43 Twist neighbor protein [Larimichthys crocea]|uniref:DNA-directed RNA polymerase subunit n=1 Tax=Larimichthys crocea TaxID=215358 RepID=A0A6G0HSC4_LARCR|nr:DNA-directed RNA polymerase I subunit RPA43 Twist neighbor protein [Larimichthys crocea]